MRAVLMYHALDDEPSPVSLAPRHFERHLEWMVRDNINVVSFRDFCGGDDNRNTLALTFDDGFVDFAQKAWPRLKDRGMPATLFIVSAHVGGSNRWADETIKGLSQRDLLDWDDLGRLHEEGCEIACHTHRHRHLTSLSDEEVEDEINTCLETMERHLGFRPSSLAYPYGDVNRRVRDLASGMVKAACTTRFSLAESNLDCLAVPRLDAWYFQHPGLLESFGQASFARFVWRRRLLRQLRRSLTPAGSRSMLY